MHSPVLKEFVNHHHHHHDNDDDDDDDDDDVRSLVLLIKMIKIWVKFCYIMCKL